MEKTFIDWYLLAMSVASGETAAGDSKMFVSHILDHLRYIGVIFKKLNTLEVCLLIEVALKFGTDMQKKRAKALAKQVIDRHLTKEADEHYFKDGNLRAQIFD